MHSQGFWETHVVLSPVIANDSNFEKCKKVVLKNKPIISLEEKKAEVEKTLMKKDFINAILMQYNEEKKFEKQTKKNI